MDDSFFTPSLTKITRQNKLPQQSANLCRWALLSINKASVHYLNNSLTTLGRALHKRFISPFFPYIINVMSFVILFSFNRTDIYRYNIEIIESKRIKTRQVLKRKKQQPDTKSWCIITTVVVIDQILYTSLEFFVFSARLLSSALTLTSSLPFRIPGSIPVYIHLLSFYIYLLSGLFHLYSYSPFT